jgi:homoserine O-acetyltransferase
VRARGAGSAAGAGEHRDRWWESPTAALGKVCHLSLPEGFEAVHGGRLDRIQVAYESWGELNHAGDNGVLVCHTLTSDCHAAGDFRGEPHGWWEALIGPGRPLDTDRWFVVCPNLLGSCYGSTGPRFPAPDSEPFLERFPLLTPLDLMRVQRLFVRQLGITRLQMVIGPSLGGMIAWEWAIEGGDLARLVVVVAAPLRTTPYQIGLNWLQRRGVELDLDPNAASAAWGQMVSRGIGMLSYRSPVGLDEKFGREWFSPPGATLGERGMFNVESWLRYQGRKMVKRFDPYSYILLSRAMDLFDVSEGRGSLVTALDRVRCRTLVVGISSDNLYPASEVHLGADVLNHLGKPVEYAEIRSPHGHDAFLLESAQLGAIVRDAHVRVPRPVPTAGQAQVRAVRLGILGAGRVARSFLALLDERREQLELEDGLRFEVRAVADVDPGKLLDPAFAAADTAGKPEQLVVRDDVDVLVEVTRGGDTRALVEAALRRRRPVVTVNKLLVRRHGPALEQLALANGVRLAYHNAVAAGWPLIYAVERPLVREQFHAIESVLSSTCNVILERMEAGDSLADALAQAAALEVTEQDPELDLSGWDTAQKLLILVARTLGLRFGIEQLTVRGLDDLDAELVRVAPALGLRVKLVGLFVRPADGRPVAGVLPAAVPADSHLGGVRGVDNAIVLRGEETGELVHLGKGSGNLPVATALLNDLIGLFRPGHSWTGRFPPAGYAPAAPGFSRFLARAADGSVGVVEGAPPNADLVPLLDSMLVQ